jgi:hypothetical protein
MAGQTDSYVHFSVMTPSIIVGVGRGGGEHSIAQEDVD